MGQSRFSRRLGLIALGVLGLGLAGAWHIGALERVAELARKNNPKTLYQKIRDEGLSATIDAFMNKAADASNLPTLRYSLQPGSKDRPPVEDAQERSALPEYKILPGAPVADLRASQDHQPDHAHWHRSHGNDYSDKFSSLTQIDRSNVQQLQVAWVHRSGVDLGDKSKIGLTVQTNPVYAGGLLFVTDTAGHLIALHAASGKEAWRLELPTPVARRGLIWQAAADFAKSRLFVPTGAGVYAVNAASGTIDTNFGEQGKVGDQVSLVAPAIVGDKLIIGSLRPALEAYDLTHGKLLWRRLLLDKPQGKGAFIYGGAPWAGMSSDAGRKAIYVATGNPRPQLVGTTRPGENKQSCSIVSINAETGEINWSFQEVSHDLWDLDIPAPPVLTTVSKDGRRVDVVAAISKLGNTLILDRDSGRPLFDYRMRRAPTSTLPGERTMPYQPALQVPEPFTQQGFGEADITDLSDSAYRYVQHKLRDARYGLFEPPSLGGTVAAFGLQGGAEWPGAAVDPRSATLYLPSNQIPWLIRLNLQDMKGDPKAEATVPGHALYQARCATCHGASRQGRWDGEREGDTYFPSLVGISLLRPADQLESTTAFERAHRFSAAAAPTPNGSELQQLASYFSALDRRTDQARGFMIDAYWQLLLDDQGNPGSKPPWGHVTAMDLNTGRIKWQIPFGEYEKLYRKGSKVRGQRNTGGVIATAGGLVFATGTVDNKVRAYAAEDGSELWAFKLPAAGSTPPSTYLHEGVQYLVIVASGGSHVGFSGRSDQIIAFKLPQTRKSGRRP